MKNKTYLILLLIISIVGISTGLYLKFIRSYTDESFQIRTAGELKRPPTLGETINYLEELETIKGSAINDQNDDTLQRLQTINLTSMILLVISTIIAIGTTQKISTKEKCLRNRNG